MGEWKWETGMNFNQIDDFERIRDYGLMVIYSNWSFLKNELKDNKKYKNRALDWVAYIAGKRESRRLLGDYILKQDDIDKKCLSRRCLLRHNLEHRPAFPGFAQCITLSRCAFQSSNQTHPYISLCSALSLPIFQKYRESFYGGPQYQCYPCGTGHCPRNAYHRNDGRSCRDGSFLM